MLNKYINLKNLLLGANILLVVYIGLVGYSVYNYANTIDDFTNDIYFVKPGDPSDIGSSHFMVVKDSKVIDSGNKLNLFSKEQLLHSFTKESVTLTQLKSSQVCESIRVESKKDNKFELIGYKCK